MSHLQLASALRRIAKSASHPNALVYTTQLERARQKYLVREELGDGKKDALLLEEPEEEDRKREREREKAELEVKKGNGSEGAERRLEEVKGGEVADRGRGDGEERCVDGAGEKDGPSL